MLDKLKLLGTAPVLQEWESKLVEIDGVFYAPCEDSLHYSFELMGIVCRNAFFAIAILCVVGYLFLSCLDRFIEKRRQKRISGSSDPENK